MDIGTWQWAQRTGGRIGIRDRMKLAAQGTAALIADLPPLLRYRLGLNKNFPRHLDLDDLSVPDSACALAANEMLEAHTPPYMVNHSIRTYWFSRLLGEGRGEKFDNELLYVAGLLHDMGFFPPYDEARPDAECFTIRSAEAALELAREAEWDDHRCERLADTLTLNINPDVGPEQGLEAHLMQKGVLVDILGFNAWNIHPQTIEHVFERYPRLDQKDRIYPMFRDEALRHRKCRGYFVTRYLQFGMMVRMNPWD